MSLIYIFILFIVSIIIFLVMREFWCWYWKINERIDLLRSIDSKLPELPKPPNSILNSTIKKSISVDEGEVFKKYDLSDHDWHEK